MTPLKTRLLLLSVTSVCPKHEHPRIPTRIRLSTVLAALLMAAPLLAPMASASTATVTSSTLPSGRAGTSAVWDGAGNAYIFGGFIAFSNQYGQSGDTTEIVRYTPATNTVTTMTATLPKAASETSAVWDGAGNAYIFGGMDSNNNALNTIVRYTPATNTVTTMTATLPNAASETSAVWDGAGNAYVFGGLAHGMCCGMSSNNKPLNTIVRYTPATNTVTTMTGTLPNAGPGTGAVWDGNDGNAYIFGAASNDQVLRYNPTTDTAIMMNAQVNSNGGAGNGGLDERAAWDGSNAYVFSANNYGHIARYNPATDMTTTMSAYLPSNALSPSAIWAGSSAYVFGGYNGGYGGQTLNQIVRFDPTPGVPGAPQFAGNSFDSTPGEIQLGWWQAGSDAPVTNYRVYRGSTSGGEVLVTNGGCSNLGNVQSCRDSGLGNGVTEYYKISAVSPMGEGPQSNEFLATTPSLPSAPQSPQASSISNQITLSWAPADPHGSNVISYKVYRGPTSGSETPLTSGRCGNLGNVLSCTDSISDPAGTTEYYKVSAVNSVGEGPQSSEVYATTSPVLVVKSLPAPVELASAAADPSGNSWVFGGDNGSQATDRIASPDVHWGAKLPTPRYGTSAVADGTGNIYVFAGVQTQTATTVTVGLSFPPPSPIRDSIPPVPSTKGVTQYTLPGTSFNRGNMSVAPTYDTPSGQIVQFNTQTGNVNVMKGSLLLNQGLGTSAVWDGGGHAYVFGGCLVGQKTQTTPNAHGQQFGSGDVQPVEAISRYTPGTDTVDFPLTMTPMNDGGYRLPTPRCGTSAVWDGVGHAYIFGGYDGQNVLDEIVVFDPNANTATRMAERLPVPLAWTSAVWDGSGNAYIFGGTDMDGHSVSTIYKYTPATHEIALVGQLPNPARTGTAATWVNGHAVVMGGKDTSGSLTKQAAAYTPWPAGPALGVKGASLSSGRWGAASFSDGSSVYFAGGGKFGGNWHTWTDQIVRYSPATDTFTPMGSRLPTPREGMSAVWDGRDRPAAGCPGGCAFLFGGYDAGTLLSTQVMQYNPLTDTLAVLPEVLPLPLAYSAAVWDGFGSAYLFGGDTGADGSNSIPAAAGGPNGLLGYPAYASSFAWTNPSSTVLRYTPDLHKVSLVSAMPIPLAAEGAFWDGAGHAYIVGQSNNDYREPILRFDAANGTVTPTADFLPEPNMAPLVVPDGAGNAYLFNNEALFDKSSVATSEPGISAYKYMPTAHSITPLAVLARADISLGAVGWTGSNAYLLTHSGNANGIALFAPSQLASPATPPSAPQYPSATPGTSGVTIGWQLPVSDGGSPITSYSVYRSPAGAGSSETFAATVAGTTYLDTSCQAGCTYRVTAMNAQGEGAFSLQAIGPAP